MALLRTADDALAVPQRRGHLPDVVVDVVGRAHQLVHLRLQLVERLQTKTAPSARPLMCRGPAGRSKPYRLDGALLLQQGGFQLAAVGTQNALKKRL